jgi:drug/metabolite transporter (DMT)-like permease
MFAKYKYYILLHITIFVWGFTGILGKKIQLEAINIVWFRFLIAFLSLVLGLWLLKLPLKIQHKKQFWATLGVGVFVALHWVTFYQSIQLSTASLGVLCLSTTTLHVTWLEPLVMNRKFSWLEFSMGVVVIYGIYIVSDDFKGKELEALAFGLTSALCAALFSVFNAKLAKEGVPSSALTLHEMGVGFIFMTILMFATNQIDATIFVMRWEDFAWLLFLGIICTSIAFLTTIEVVKKLGAFTVTLSINLEPVYTIILAIVLLNENKKLNGSFYIGATLIIFVVIANAVIKHYLSKQTSSRILQSEKDH